MHEAFSNPKDNVLQMALREGMKVGDFGAGSGHYSRAAAAIVGPGGRVYAIDVQEDVLKHLKLNTLDHHKTAIETIWGDIEKLGGTHLRDESLDAIILANAFFQIENRAGLLAEMKRVLKPGGKVLVVDWAESYNGLGPSKESVVSEEVAEKFFTEGGFEKVKSFSAGAHHYGVLFVLARV